MGYGIEVKNKQGEILVDSIKGMPRVLGWHKAAYSSYSYRTLTSSDEIPNPIFFFQVTNAYSNPSARKVDDTHQEIYNRFFMGQSPNPSIKALVASLGTGGNESKGKHGITVYDAKSLETVSVYGTLQIKYIAKYTANWSTISGAYNGWITGPATYNFTEMKEEPYVICNPLIFRSFYQASNNQQRFAQVFYVTKSSLTQGIYLYQTSQWALAGETLTIWFFICSYKGEY